MFELTLTLPKDPISPGRARHALDGLRDELPQDVAERSQVVISELVTNAVMHAPPGADIRLEARLSIDELRVAVVQPGPMFEPVIGKPEVGQESGWGLHLVSNLADRWGIIDNAGVTVWCEFDLPTSPQMTAVPRNGHRTGGSQRSWSGFAA
jgi:anti-sigma regulatory factor (Ser/Thr protein kinase)